MPFDCGVPPPRSKYHGVTFTLQNLDICPDGETFGPDEEDWLCSSDFIDKQQSKGDEEDFTAPVEHQQLQKYTCQQWLEQIEDRYFDERDDLVRQSFQAALDDVQEPYTFILHVMFKAFFDLFSKRIPITYYALDELEIWQDLKQANAAYVPQPEDSHKEQAMDFVCRGGYNYLDKVNKLFLLDQGDNSFLSKYIHLDIEHLHGKKLKQIVVILYTLKLQHYYEQKEIMLPLLACDQIQVLETYIGDDETLQQAYALFLDSLCAMKEDSVIDEVRTMGLSVKDPSKLQHKTLTKIAEKVVKKYNLNPDLYPNVFNAKNIAGLCYLVRMKCKEERNSSSGDATCQKWDNLIETAVSGKPFLQVKLVEKLNEYGNISEACKYAKKYYISPQKLPQDVIDEMTEYVTLYKDHTNCDVERFSGDKVSSGATDEDWEEEVSSDSSTVSFSLATGFTTNENVDQYYKLNLSLGKICLVYTIEGLQQLTKNLFSNAKVVAFDAEWKPIVCRAGEQDRISILQLAVSDNVYILDLFKLYLMPNSEDDLKDFFTLFFTSKNTVKIGYGIVGDLKILIGMFGYVKELVKNCSKLVDLGEVSIPIINHPLVIPYLYPAGRGTLMGKGLSLLVSRTLGSKLDKTFQVSDWERRPLNPEQLHYAALDAYCLLEVYSFLQDVVNKTKVKANLTQNLKLKWLKTGNNAKRKDKFEKQTHKELIPKNEPLFKGIPRPSTTLKVVCDTMLQGLGTYLRACGVDAMVLTNDQDHSSVINISIREKRVVLTRGKPFFMLRGYLPDGNCMWVPEGTVKEQVKMVFTRYNIALHTQDILSRCTACNCNKYINIKSEEMKQAYELKNDVGNSEMTADQKTVSGLINLSNYCLENGTELRLDFVSPSKYESGLVQGKDMFANIDMFYVCENCGKVYWEGSHHEAVKTNFRDLIDKREDDKLYYGTPG